MAERKIHPGVFNVAVRAALAQFALAAAIFSIFWFFVIFLHFNLNGVAELFAVWVLTFVTYWLSATCFVGWLEKYDLRFGKFVGHNWVSAGPPCFALGI